MKAGMECTPLAPSFVPQWGECYPAIPGQWGRRPSQWGTAEACVGSSFRKDALERARLGAPPPAWRPQANPPPVVKEASLSGLGRSLAVRGVG